ncbi:programmed cell death protein 2 [Geopyxis carbonaria]|nr:programmed cell death protein 2 [Geopyxis carbonaria]
MADSDSDLDDFTETTVLLGYAEREAKDDEVSHLGGAPTWLVPTSPLDSRLAKCGACNKLMPLLLQLNGAVPQSPHERMFYVWACAGKTCRRKPGSVRALRCVRVSKAFEQKEADKKRAGEEWLADEERRRREAAEKPRVDMGGMLFGGGAPAQGQGKANPFAAGAPVLGAANPFASSNTPAAPAAATPAAGLSKSFADTLRISLPPVAAAAAPEPLLYGPPEPWPSPLPHTYPHFFLDAAFETLDPTPPTPPQNIETLISSDLDSSLPASDSAADDGSLDTAFQAFADRVAQNPEQVLRYERGGKPLLYSDTDAVAKVLLDAQGGFSTRKIPACGNCGKRERVVEFQVMPHAISVLEGEEALLEGMEWGTVVVATCLCVPQVRDADGVGWVEEWVGVQWEGQK